VSRDYQPQRLKEAMVALLPGLGEVGALQRIEIGFGNENWIAESKLGRVTVKVGLSTSNAEKWRSAGIAINLAHSAGLPVPELLAFDPCNEMLNGRILRLFSFIEGSSPATLDGAPTKRGRFFRQLGEAIRLLHSIKQPEFNSRIGGENGFPRWSDYVANRWRDIVARSERAGLDGELLTKATGALSPLISRFDDVALPVICHRDLHFDNMLCDGDGNLVALLDFDIAEAWEPAGDFHKLRWWVFGSDANAERQFNAGYWSDDSIPENFDDRVRVVEIVELINGMANWKMHGQSVMVTKAETRLRALFLDGPTLEKAPLK
jgi:aminoglycoside phosphotransferase (APT) family kinase protein